MPSQPLALRPAAWGNKTSVTLGGGCLIAGRETRRSPLLKQFVTPRFRHFQRLVYTLFGLHSFLFDVRTCSVSSSRSSFVLFLVLFSLCLPPTHPINNKPARIAYYSYHGRWSGRAGQPAKTTIIRIVVDRLCWVASPITNNMLFISWWTGRAG